MPSRLALGALAALATLLASGAAHAQLNVLCSMQIEWCQAAANAFEKQTGIRVSLQNKGSGESFAQINAEKENPKTDIWFGGTGDPHLQAAELGLTVEYKSPNYGELHRWAQRQAEIGRFRTVGIYAGALGFGYNTELLASKKLPVPACWKDLLRPEFKGEIQMANPNSSGTAYTVLATLTQIMGEDEAMKYLKALHGSINQYTRSGAAPIKAAARGETTIGIVFLHDVVTEAVAKFPVKPVSPCEGTGYEIGSMSIVNGARNLDNARRFYDWALTVEAQKIAAANKSYQLPSNRGAPQPPEAPRFSDMKLIDYDIAKYGSAAERKRLLARWDKEVGSQPR